MDWSKAKSILIVSFLILNLLLAYRLYLEPTLALASDGLSKEQIESIETMLQKHGVNLSTALPSAAPRVPIMHIQVHSYNEQEISKLKTSILGPNAIQVSPNTLPFDDQLNFADGFKDLNITARGYVTYYNRDLQVSNDMITADEAKAIGHEFFTERLGAPTDFVFDSVSYIEPMGYRVDYVQTHKGSYVFPGYIMMIVKPSGVYAMWMCRLDITTQLLAKKTIITAHEALLNLLSYRINAGESSALTIHGVDMGFYDTIYDAEQSWQIPPVWRVRSDAGDYYINALSGIIEQ